MSVAQPNHPKVRQQLRIGQVFNGYLQANSVARIADDLESSGHSVKRFWRSSKEWKGAGAPPKLVQPLRLWRDPAVLDELRRVHESHKADLCRTPILMPCRPASRPSSPVMHCNRLEFFLDLIRTKQKLPVVEPARLMTLCC